MKLTTNFYLEEFVTPQLLRKCGDKAIMFIDSRIPPLAQFFRDRYGKPITINDSEYYTLSGLRPLNSPIGASKSAHKFGRAIDLKWLQGGPIPDEIREDIKAHNDIFMNAGLRRVEEGTPTWLHADIVYTMLDYIKFIPYY